MPMDKKRSNAMKKATLIYRCRSGHCSGHINRVLAVAQELSERFHVTVFLDCSVSREIQAPDGVDLLILPTGDAAERRSLILSKVMESEPRVIVVENFPFCRHEQKEEILPLIQLIRGNAHEESLVVSVTDGVYITDDLNAEKTADMSADFLERYFDMVVVQSDPMFARLEEFFQPNNVLSTPIFHTGFVSPVSHLSHHAGHRTARGILVSAGDGYRGGALFRAAIEAHRILRQSLPLPMTIVAGRHLPEDEWQELQSLSDASPALTLTRTVPDLRAEVANAQLSIGQCGYDAAVNALAVPTHALFIPRADGRFREQLVRAQRLVYWGAGRLMLQHLLNGASLANEIHQFTNFERREISFDLDGAAKTAALIADVVYQNNYAPEKWRPDTHTRSH